MQKQPAIVYEQLDLNDHVTQPEVVTTPHYEQLDTYETHHDPAYSYDAYSQYVQPTKYRQYATVQSTYTPADFTAASQHKYDLPAEMTDIQRTFDSPTEITTVQHTTYDIPAELTDIQRTYDHQTEYAAVQHKYEPVAEHTVVQHTYEPAAEYTAVQHTYE